MISIRRSGPAAPDDRYHSQHRHRQRGGDKADGKLVVVGQTYKNNDFSGEDFVVTRYNTDGTLDNTLAPEAE